jgi:mRNA interferase RelE/StbE
VAKYKIKISSTAEKSLKKVAKKEISKIIGAIQSLAVDPYPAGCRKLTGEENVYRIRKGNYRILYEVHGNQLTILVLKVAHRKNVYN